MRLFLVLWFMLHNFHQQVHLLSILEGSHQLELREELSCPLLSYAIPILIGLGNLSELLSIGATSLVRCSCFFQGQPLMLVTQEATWERFFQWLLTWFLWSNCLPCPLLKLCLHAYVLCVFALLRIWILAFLVCFLLMFEVNAELLITYIDHLMCFWPSLREWFAWNIHLKTRILMPLFLLLFLKVINSSAYLWI